MIGTKCPGQDMRYWTSDDIHESKCPECGAMIEFWKTDIRVRCPECKAKVANPKFNLGCAQWCAYAEQCLGPAARGLKTKPLREILDEEISRLAAASQEDIDAAKALLTKMEEKSSDRGGDMLPMAAATVIYALHERGYIDDIEKYTNYLIEEKNVPQKAIENAREIISVLDEGEKGGDREAMMREVLGV